MSLYDKPGEMQVMLPSLKKINCPVMLLCSSDVKTQVPHVYYDQWSSGYTAMHHLLDSGYRRFLFLKPYERWWVDERVKGALIALGEEGYGEESLLLHPSTAEYGCFTYWKRTPNQRRDHLAEILDKGLQLIADEGGTSAPTCVIAPTDFEGMPVLEMIKERRLIPGEDIGVIGFDDHHFAWQRGLTSVRPPIEEMAETAARMLLSAIRGIPLPEAIRLAPKIIVRASTGGLMERLAGNGARFREFR